MSVLGIDFGTTNTVAAVTFRVVPIVTEQSSPILPTAVAFPPSGITMVGTGARRRRAIDAKNTILSAKRVIGRRWSSAEVDEFRTRYPFELVEVDGGPAFKTRAGLFTPQRAGSLVLAKVAEAAGVDPADTKAVVTVPAGFNEDCRRATVEAVRGAGFVRVALVDEPVATAIAYLSQGETALETAVVYDLGGGTFDVAVLDCRQMPFRVLSHGGDTYLGGDDIDYAIAEWAAEDTRRRHRWDLKNEPVVFDRLVVECERAKIRLCYAASTTIDLAQVDPAAPAGASSLPIDAEMLSKLSLELVSRSFVLCDAVLAEAEVKARDVDAVFLAGGTTQLPIVRDAVGQYFGKPARSEFDPMEVVGIGASLAGSAKEYE